MNVGVLGGVQTRRAVERFNAALNGADLQALTDAITDDCVFESTQPPDGRRYAGRADVVSFFRELLDSAARRRFDVEELLVAGDRATVLWSHRWSASDGSIGRVRGVDVFRVRGGKVAEKLSYVKG